MSLSLKRIALCYFLCVVLLFVCAFRIFSVMSRDNYRQVAEQTSRRVIDLEFSRGTIFDTNMNRITNSNEIYYAVIFKEAKTSVELYNLFSAEEIEDITRRIDQNGFAVRKIANEVTSNGIYCIKAYAHADDSLIAKHIIGYTDLEGKGVCGLEAAYNETLLCKDKNQIIFTIDGQGKIIDGYSPELNFNYNIQNSGVKITIDKSIQQIAEQKAMNINCGAVVITEIKTGKIRALVSRPDYKLSDLASAVIDENEPMLNRAFCTYNIGSVFKPLVAAVGYESGKAMETECNGYANIDGLTFACHKTGGHGAVNLSTALKYSCNTFFYQFIQRLNTDSVFLLAQKAGFDSSAYLCSGISTSKGNLGETKALRLTKRDMANISIGQGELMTSPIAITNLYMAIANGGVYTPPSLIEGRVEDMTLVETKTQLQSVRLFSENTAEKLKKDLSAVLDEDGTGKAAKPECTTAAGKTGTAQTGVVKGGEKVTNSWFCGFFPLDNPKYAVTILSENAKGGCGGIFADIADEITKLESGRS